MSVNKKENKKEWLTLSFMFPIVWLTLLFEYFEKKCVGWVRFGQVCGEDSLYILVVFFFFCFSFPLIYFFKIKKRIE